MEAQPDNLLTVCAYCGTLYPTTELSDIPVHIVPSVEESAVREAVIKRMAQDAQMKGVSIDITDATGVYVPLFISQASVEGRWKGYRTERRNKQTVKIWEDGDIDHCGDYPVLARKHAYEFGLQGIGRVVFDASPIPMSEMTWESAALPVLSVDMSNEQVDAAVEDDLIDQLGVAIKGRNRLDAITEFEADVTIHNRLLLLYPLWTVTYRYRGGSYKVAVCGGGPTVLSAMEPVFFGQRLFRLGLGIAAVGGSGALFFAAIVLLPVLAGDDESAGALLAFGAGILACAWAAFSTAKRLVASVNVEHIGEKRGWL